MGASTFVCLECHSAVTGELHRFPTETTLDEADRHDLVPRGTYFVSPGEFEPELSGDYLVNLKDLRNTRHHSDLRRLNGCCGLDGQDGFNILCENDHEVGIERSDCRHAHHSVSSCLRVTDA